VPVLYLGYYYFLELLQVRSGQQRRTFMIAAAGFYRPVALLYRPTNSVTALIVIRVSQSLSRLLALIFFL